MGIGETVRHCPGGKSLTVQKYAMQTAVSFKTPQFQWRIGLDQGVDHLFRRQQLAIEGPGSDVTGQLKTSHVELLRTGLKLAQDHVWWNKLTLQVSPCSAARLHKMGSTQSAEMAIGKGIQHHLHSHRLAANQQIVLAAMRQKKGQIQWGSGGSKARYHRVWGNFLVVQPDIALAAFGPESGQARFAVRGLREAPGHGISSHSLPVYGDVFLEAALVKVGHRHQAFLATILLAEKLIDHLLRSYRYPFMGDFLPEQLLDKKA